MKAKENFLKILVPILSILIAFIIGGIVISCLGKNPLLAYQSLFAGAFGSSSKLAQTLTIACPLIFTGLAATVAYKCGVFNLGGEGQFIMGALASVWFATQVTCVRGATSIIISLILGAIAGGIWGAIPGILKTVRGLNEMIVSILMNYFALYFMGFIYTNVLRDGSVPQTFPVPDESKLPRISGDFKVHIGFLIAVVIAVLLHLYLNQTASGMKLKAVGMNQTAAGINGFAVKKYFLFSFILSGAVAGLGGSIELHGKQYRLMSGFGDGFGFDGVAIALIAQLNPIATVIIAIFFAILRKGASAMQATLKIPTSVVDMIEALVIVFAVAGSALLKLPSTKAFLDRISSGIAGKKKQVKEA